MTGDAVEVPPPTPVREMDRLWENLAENRRRKQQQREQQRVQAQQMDAVRQLANGIAHDFNNILGSVIGFAQFIVDDTDPALPQSQYAKRILTAGQRANALVSKILTFSRNRTPTRATCDLGGLVDETRELLAAIILPATTFVTKNMATDVQIDADRDQITQVLLNLCVNANDALEGAPGIVTLEIGSPPPGAALERVTGRPADGLLVAAPDVWRRDDGLIGAVFGAVNASRPYIALTVTDTGCGMSEDVVHRIFDPFFTTKDVGRGTGLGLAVVHGSVLAHEGALLLQTGPGKGTRFDVLLPVSDQAPRGVPQTVHAPKPADGPARILLVDDDVDFGDMLKMALDREGYDVAVCVDPEDAAETLRQPHRFDLLITDQTMPKMCGTDLARIAHALSPELPCVLCTGNATSDILDIAKDAGIVTVIRKPFDLHKFMLVVRDVLRGGRPMAAD